MLTLTGLHFLRSSLQLWLKRRLQGLLSTLGIIAGVAGLVLVIALGQGAGRQLQQALGSLGAGSVIIRAKAEGDSSLALSHRDRIAALFSAAAPLQAPVRYASQSVASSEQRVDAIRIIATDRHYPALYPLQLHSGRFLADYDLVHRQPVCVLGWELGRMLFPRGQVLGQQVRIGSRWFRVVGWLKPAALDLPSLGLSEPDRSAYIPLGTLAQGADDATVNALDELTLRFPREAQLAQGLKVVKRIVDGTDINGTDINGHGIKGSGAQAGVEYVIPVEVLRQKQKVQQLVRYALLGVAGLMLVVGGIGIMNVMMVSVLSRRAEIGLRRAVGATREHILVQFVTESLVVAVAGGLLGVVAGLVLSLSIEALTRWPVDFSPLAAVAGFAVSVVIGIVFGTYPALQAASVSPIEALNDL